MSPPVCARVDFALRILGAQTAAVQAGPRGRRHCGGRGAASPCGGSASENGRVLPGVGPLVSPPVLVEAAAADGLAADPS